MSNYRDEHCNYMIHVCIHPQLPTDNQKSWIEPSSMFRFSNEPGTCELAYTIVPQSVHLSDLLGLWLSLVEFVDAGTWE